MTEYTAISREHHANLSWQRPTNYFFVAKDPVATLTSQEISRALLSMAIGFIESEGTYIPVGVQGLKQGQNKCVSHDGRWLVDYVPAVHRAFPFRLGRNPEGADVLCIDEAAAQVSDRKDGEPFFMPDGAPAKSLTDVFNLLVELEKDRQNTQKGCEALARHDLLEPWPLRVQDGAEVLEPNGLFRIAEAKLYGLDPVALAEIRDSGALMIAYGQLFSMQQIHRLGNLGTASRNTAQAPALNIFDQSGTISFANL